ncbi:MAG: hypothetical protein ABW199_06645 [Caulobacterales bacterium]
MQDLAKFDHLLDFADHLPAIRQKVARDLRKRGLPREKVLAIVVQLLETTLIRVGNDEYAAQNGSYGLTTMKARHAAIMGEKLRFTFRGKSGKEWRLELKDRRIARTMRMLQDLPGQHLFQYEGGDGDIRRITSTDVNNYLREAAAGEATAKDFRTWAGTVLAASLLTSGEAPTSATSAKRALRDCVASVSKRLGNTPAICLKCYVHPAVVKHYLQNTLELPRRRTPRWLTPEEQSVRLFLRRLRSRMPYRPALSMKPARV